MVLIQMKDAVSCWHTFSFLTANYYYYQMVICIYIAGSASRSLRISKTTYTDKRIHTFLIERNLKLSKNLMENVVRLCFMCMDIV